MPKKPIPFGSLSLYPKKEKTLSFDYFHKHRWGLNDKQITDTLHYNKMQQAEELLKEQMEIDQEALNEYV
jgi:hypothetical protein